MIPGLFAGFVTEAQFAARRAAFVVIGLVLVLVGCGFLVAAIWVLLADIYGALVATLVIAGVFIGLGLVFLGLSRRAYRRSDLRVAAETGAATRAAGSPGAGAALALIPIVEAFVAGLRAGSSRRSR